MPGMMDTVLNLGLNDETVEALAADAGDARFAYDSYRRFIQMYSDVVLGSSTSSSRRSSRTRRRGAATNSTPNLPPTTGRRVIALYKAKVEEELGKPFPAGPEGATLGRDRRGLFELDEPRAPSPTAGCTTFPKSWGTAVNVQAMVFGNMGDTSATGVAFTRNPSTGEKALYGEFLVNAQGEDVVAGIRTPQNITEAARIEAGSDKPSLQKMMPEAFASFVDDLRHGSRSTIATCRTSNSPSSAASSGCCRRARASAPPRRR